MPLEDPSRKADLSWLLPTAQAVHQVKRRCLTWGEAEKKQVFHGACAKTAISVSMNAVGCCKIFRGNLLPGAQEEPFG